MRHLFPVNSMLVWLKCGKYLLVAALLGFSVTATVAGARGIGADQQVLLVCNGSTTPCPPGRPYFTTIQSAVDTAQTGDWILIWPGSYHENGATQAGVYVTVPGLHLRGMDRNRVVVDGTAASTGKPCPSDAASQVLAAGGRDGIEVFKVDGVTIENLTVCNYLADDTGQGGNEIWWNGGDGSGQIGMHAYSGAYLTATSTYFKDANSAMAQYGIFVSNAAGPGTLTNSYASNMGDSGFYVGACPDCNAILDHVHAQNNSLGFSGTNSGGHLIVQNSEWDQNKTGLLPNSLNNTDAPSPQSGLCPDGGIGPLGTRSCTIFRGNHIHDNNNSNVPAFGISSAAPVGAGLIISGGKFDTIIDNQVDHQGAWGILTTDFPDTEPPPPIATCRGGIPLPGVCFFNARGNQIIANRLANNGSFGNPTNGDLANEATARPKNCFFGNTDPVLLTSDPPDIQNATVDGPPCAAGGPGDGTELKIQLYCASGLLPCPPGSSYPRPTEIQLRPSTRQLSMPDPCADVPANPWCPDSRD